MQLNTRQRDQHAGHVQRQSNGHDRQGAEFLDQVPGEKTGCKHANHMPLQHQRRVRKGQAADLHGDRCGGHQEVHHAITERAGRGRHDENRLAHDHAQRAPARAGRPFGRGRRKVDDGQQQHGQQGHTGQRQVSAGKRHGGQTARGGGQVGPGNCT